MKHEHYYQLNPENGIFQKTEKKQFFVSKALNTVSPAVLSASSLIIVYQLSLSMMYYFVIPLAILSVYYLIWLSFRLSRLQYDNHKMSDKIDIVMRQNRELYEYTSSQKIALAPLKFGESEIYIKYKQLNVTFLSDFLREFENFYLLMYGVFNSDPMKFKKYYSGEKFDKIEFIEYVKTIIKSKPENILVLDHIHTGESIKIRPHTSWKIDWDKFKEEGDLNIYTPLGFYIFYFSVKYLSLGIGSVYAGCEIVDKIADKMSGTQIRNEQQIMLDENVSKLKNEFELLPEYIKEAIKDSTNNILEITVRNENVQEITIKVSK